MIQRRDIIAGISIAGLMLPESVAYSAIAGLEPTRAVIAGICGCLAYAAVGKSRFAIVAPTSSSAAILAATLASMPGTVAQNAANATLAVLLAGIFFLIASFLRLGNLTGFISRPVLRGFAFGLALTIIIHQLPVLFGISVHADDLFHFAVRLFADLPQYNAYSAGIGAAAILLLVLLKRFPTLPGPLLILAGGIAFSIVFNLESHGVVLVGAIPMSLDLPVFPPLAFDTYSRMGQLTVPLALILFAESWGTIRGLAVKHGDEIEANRELGALGFANLLSAFGQGMPVGAGFSAGSANEAAGAQTRVAGVIAAIGLGLLVVFGGRYIALLPQAVPAAVVIAALLHSLDLRPFIRLWRIDRDNYIAALTALGILVFGVLDGMLVAMALSLGAMIAKLATPYIAQLGQLGNSRDYVDISRHEDANAVPHVAIWRPAVPLFYANADTVFRTISARTRSNPVIRVVIVSLEESFDLDSTALDLLLEFDASMKTSGLEARYARVHDHIRDLFVVAAADDVLRRSFYSVDDAVRGVVSHPQI